MNSVLIPAALLVPLIFAAMVAWMPAAKARSTALLGTLVAVVPVLMMLFSFNYASAASFQFAGRVDWLPAFGLSLSVGVDSISLLLIALTALLGPLCVLGSWTAIVERQRMFYVWLLVLQTAMIGVFCARDLVVFYICFEFTLLPMFILIGVFGSTNRKVASIKFFLYTFTGSLIALAGLVYVAFHASQHYGVWTLDIGELAVAAQTMSPRAQGWVLAAMLAGFAVKVPLFPVHTWLPLAHTEAPTAGSVILAGVLLKLGTYGIYRFVLGFVPLAVMEYAPMLAMLSIVGIIYAGLICWVQTDVKKLVAYSSVSHLGFCVLGLVAVNAMGVSGSVLYMISHGLSTGALFLLIGFMYERYHTRDMGQIGGLAAKMPVWSTFMVFFVMASVGLPGLNGFVSEFLCLIGTFQSSSALAATEPGATSGSLGPWFAVAAGFGMVVGAIYLLYMVGRVVFGPLIEPADHHDGHGPLPRDLCPREIVALLPLALGCLVFGLYPKPLLSAIEQPVNISIQNYQFDASPRSMIDAGVVSRTEQLAEVKP
ncbi:MAG: NADH-quinone oxidoreductase subunit M [Phycisphaeraceae bacterium]|nr:NADH-quinone oxidoreductase subunit M [Phycisphaeraceae bacterium]MCW5761936.1 NADH-quinone oxidoreductase subunit M [Phycisphaeraceae bacterium]